MDLKDFVKTMKDERSVKKQMEMYRTYVNTHEGYHNLIERELEDEEWLDEPEV